MQEYLNELSDNLILLSIEKSKDRYIFLVESNLKSVVCPYCGVSSSKCHSKYYKAFDDIPLNGKRVTINIKNRKMFFDNPDCNHKTFSETFEFVSRRAKRTQRLNEYILDISKNISSINAEKTLKKNGIKIGKSTICTFLKKNSDFINYSEIEIVGIDDFSFKKHHTYGTVMVDQKTHKIISLINSRDMGDVSTWLKQFPNLKIVTRDGSIIYKNFIEMASKDIIQITDRFHLIKGLSEVLNDYIRNNIPNVLIIDKINTGFKFKTLKEKFNLTKTAIESGTPFTKACKDNDVNYRTMKKLMELNELELTKYFEDKQTKIRIENTNKKNELVFKAKQLYELGVSLREISRQMNIDRRTIKKYVGDGFKFTLDSTSRERINSCTQYEETIIKMIKQKSTVKNIYLTIVEIGYKGKYGMVKNYVSKFKQNNQLLIEDKITRKNAIKLLYKPLNKIKDITKEQLLKLYKSFPVLKKLVELMLEFKGILLKTRKKASFR